ncbi:MAG: HAD hydrolase-like protein [Prevotella sp.]|nr:HAD hydrolase-like protein [Prevotella sp.]
MINYDLKKISTIIFDVDGVLSTSTIPMSEEGEPLRTINIKDGYAIQLAVKLGLRLAIITGGKDDSVMKRYVKLGMKDIFMGCGVKVEVYRKYIAERGITPEEVMYVGDDIPDYEVMREVGCPCCPKDACPDIRAISNYVSPYDGGRGCARDVIEQVMRAKGLWLTSAKAFGW